MNQTSSTADQSSTVDLLPTVDQHPDADVVIFDGNCQFCRQSVEQLHRLDGRNRLAFVSLHDPLVAQRYPDLDHDQLLTEMYLVDQTGNRYSGADAIKYLSRRLPMLWPLALFAHLPCSMPLWRWLYASIANRRYSIAGRTGKCDEGTCGVHFERHRR